jgi:hypothetical protein
MARLAMIRMVQAYRSPLMNYKEDAREVCATLRTLYPADKASTAACAGMAVDSTTVPAKPAS